MDNVYGRTMLGYTKIKDLAELSGYTQDYIGQLIRQGKIKGIKIDGEWQVAKFSFFAYILAKKSVSLAWFDALILQIFRYKRITALAGIGVSSFAIMMLFNFLTPHQSVIYHGDARVVIGSSSVPTITIDQGDDNNPLKITSFVDDSGEVFIALGQADSDL